MRIVPALLAIGFVAASAPVASAQDWSAQPTYETVNLARGFMPDPWSRTLTAGGGTEVEISGCSFGYVANAPDVDLQYESTGGATLYIYVRSDDDTTLLINMPDGSWRCDDDDFGNRNPIVIIPNAPGGLYDIWVGTYGDDMTSATLYISEIDPRAGKNKD